MPEVRDVAVAIHLEKIDEDDLQGLAPLVLATARQGDQVARDLVSRLADEIVTMAGTVIRRLGLTGQPFPVVLGGGVLTARDPQLIGWITERLAGAGTARRGQRGAGAADRGRRPARPGPGRGRPGRRAPPACRLPPPPHSLIPAPPAAPPAAPSPGAHSSLGPPHTRPSFSSS